MALGKELPAVTHGFSGRASATTAHRRCPPSAHASPFIPPSEAGDTGDGLHQSLFSFATGAGGSTFGWYGLLAAASLVFFAFIGFDVVATTAEETRNPQKAVPIGILGSLAIVTVLYVAVSLVLTGMVDYTALEGDESTLATAFDAWGIAGDLPSDAPERVWNWWNAWLDQSATWPVAVAALERLLA